MIRVMLIDDHVLVREGVSRLLARQPDMRLVGAFDEGNAAVRFAAREAPDVAVVDMAAAGASGIDVARRLRAVSPKTQLLMLCRYARAEYVRQAFWAGASGYVLRDTAGAEVAAAVRALHAGKRYCSARVPAPALAEHSEGPLQKPSAREVKFAIRRGVDQRARLRYRKYLMDRWPEGS